MARQLTLTHSIAAGILFDADQQGCCRLQIPGQQRRFLHDAALRASILYSLGDACPGPYTYKRFWFRVTGFIALSASRGRAGTNLIHISDG